MTPNLLAACGAALYGPRWQTEIARDLDVSDRTVRRWVSGDSPIKDDKVNDVASLMEAKATVLNLMAQQIRTSGCAANAPTKKEGPDR